MIFFKKSAQIRNIVLSLSAATYRFRSLDISPLFSLGFSRSPLMALSRSEFSRKICAGSRFISQPKVGLATMANCTTDLCGRLQVISVIEGSVEFDATSQAMGKAELASQPPMIMVDYNGEYVRRNDFLSPWIVIL
jgi:hypothetical protein